MDIILLYDNQFLHTGIGSAATFTWAFLGIKLQTIYNKYFRVINIILGAFLLYCAWEIVK